jgi:proteasome lid subunit RPN8/RPN11
VQLEVKRTVPNGSGRERLVLSAALRARVIAHLRHAAPAEGVGLLATAPPVDGTIIATAFYPGTNIDRSATRYTMDPAEVVEALRDMAARDWSLGAIVHSHVRSPATPSVTDLREARYPEALMVIATLAESPPALRAWRVAVPAPGAATIVGEVPILDRAAGPGHDGQRPPGRTLER